MGYFSCNSESSIIACDPYNWEATNTNKKKNKKKRKKKTTAHKIRRFSYKDIEAATKGFSPDCFLGKGSHGSVYRALLHNGKLVVAVKKSKLNSTTTKSNATLPAENEIEILSTLQNPRFVNLLGYTFDSNHDRLIVVEYMPNGSLFDLLHSSPHPPNWPKRARFALQVARAVDTLHLSDPPVIHRDIKSSNVLLDENWNAKLGDFGLAFRGHVHDMNIKCTPQAPAPAGTLGYLDPAYIVPENLSTKSDVFSFGILLLEIISGRNAIDINYSPPSIVDWALPLIKHGEFVAICDPRIDPPDDLNIIQQLALLAVKCVRSASEKRPSMQEVVQCLRHVHKNITSPMWSGLRRQAKNQLFSSTKQQVLLNADKDPVVSTSNHANKKPSSIQLSLNVDFGKEINSKVNVRIRRSNSVGSINELRVGSDTHTTNYNQRKPVKMPVVKLKKSRSLSMLESKRLARPPERGIVLQLVKSPHLQGLDVSRLVITVDQVAQNDTTDTVQSSSEHPRNSIILY